MGNGAVLEVGTHQQLMASRGPYFVLFRQQGRSSSSSSSTGTNPISKVGMPINYVLGT
jgi:hypothetical protein